MQWTNLMKGLRIKRFLSSGYWRKIVPRKFQQTFAHLRILFLQKLPLEFYTSGLIARIKTIYIKYTDKN